MVGGGAGGGTAAAPADRVFSIGLSDNAFGPPQSASALQLKFRAGTPAADVVVAQKVTSPLTVDGDPGDWSAIAASSVAMVGPAASVGMTQAQWDAEYQGYLGFVPRYDYGISTVSARAAWDDEYVYFLLEWDDATESRFAGAWTADGGVFVRSTANEDRAHLAFAINFPGFDTAGCNAACHVKERLGDFSRDGGVQYRFRMHTNSPGESGDVWSWRAASTSAAGLADDQYWDDVMRNPDGPVSAGALNRRVDADAGIDQPLYMSEGGVNSSPDVIFVDDAGVPAAVPFDATGATDGSRIPGYYYRTPSPERGQVQAVGKWNAGRWTVEWRRARVTGDTRDVQFPDVP